MTISLESEEPPPTIVLSSTKKQLIHNTDRID
jgi:hypothetical protein